MRWSSGGTGSAQCVRCQVCQVEHRRSAHPAGKVAVSGVCVHQKAVWHPAKTYAPPGCEQRDLRYGCGIVRIGDLRENEKETSSGQKVNFRSFQICTKTAKHLNVSGGFVTSVKNLKT